MASNKADVLQGTLDMLISENHGACTDPRLRDGATDPANFEETSCKCSKVRSIPLCTG